MNRRRISPMEEHDALREREDAEKVAALRRAREKGLSSSLAEADLFTRTREKTAQPLRADARANP